MTDYGRALHEFWYRQILRGAEGVAVATEVFLFARDRGYKIGPNPCDKCGAKSGEKHKLDCEFYRG